MCASARQVVQSVDWECKVSTLFRETSLGCTMAVSSAIDWFFEHVDSGIILEDDCIPDPTFFRYCGELLDMYHEDDRIMSISGVNFVEGNGFATYSYYLSVYSLIWGWATWARAWRHYDGSLSRWPVLRTTGWLRDVVGRGCATDHWSDVFQRAHSGSVDSWYHPWMYSCWVRRGLALLPETNLVSNIGFGEDATHTKIMNRRLANRPSASMKFPLRHPPRVSHSRAQDRATFRARFAPAPPPALYRRAVRKLISCLPDPPRRWVRRVVSSRKTTVSPVNRPIRE